MDRTLAALSLIFAVACGSSDTPEATTPATPAPAATAPAAPAPDAKKTMPAHGDMAAGDAAAMYACPMHPEVTSKEAGECPKCGMALEMQEAHDHAAHDHGDEAATKADAPAATEKAEDKAHGHDH